MYRYYFIRDVKHGLILLLYPSNLPTVRSFIRAYTVPLPILSPQLREEVLGLKINSR